MRSELLIRQMLIQKKKDFITQSYFPLKFSMTMVAFVQLYNRKLTEEVRYKTPFLNFIEALLYLSMF